MVTTRDSAWIEHAPVKIRETATLSASPDEVWRHFAHNEGWVDWFPGFRECRFTSDGPHGVGSMRFVHQDQFKVHERITEWDPGRRWGMTVVEINVPVIASMAENVTLDATTEGTLVTFDIGVELSGIGRLFRRPLQSKSRRGLKTALANLNELLTSADSSATG